MKKYKFLFFIGLLLPFIMSSCNEWLNVKPEDEIDEKELFDSGEGFRHALNGIYFLMGTENMYGRNLSWGIADALAQTYDYTKTGSVANDMRYGASAYEWDNTYLKPETEAIWTETYTVVANCNNLIQQIENKDPELFYWKEREKAMIWGEALGLRAFLQFDMLRLFAAAPVTNPGSRKFIPYVDVYPSYISNLKTVDECLTFIIRDLKEAKKLLWIADSARSFDRTSHFQTSGLGEKTFLYRRGFRLNYWAATALLARVYLYAGKNEDALKEASEIMNFASKTTAFRFTDLTSSGDTKLYSDVIWGLYVIDLLQYNTKVNNMSDEKKPSFLSILEPNTIFFKGDLYLEQSGSKKIQKSNDKRFTTWIEDFEDRQTYYRFKKYDISSRPTSSDGKIANTMVPLIRMSEVYYIAAEAIYRSGAEGLEKAKSYLGYVQKMRGLKSSDRSVLDVLSATTETFESLLITDMRREWLGEGQSFFIYKRLNKNIPAEEGSEIKAEEKVFVLPLPKVETNIK